MFLIYYLEYNSTMNCSFMFSGIWILAGIDTYVPSYSLKAGDVVAVREKSKSLEAIESSLSNSSHIYEWITWNNDKKEGTYVSIPARIQIPENINEQFIVELYSK